ncbi:MAG TPA: DNA/RNA non-specific endonuclease [Prolixibacteraceae bacterium]|jgi:endonuclease G
MRKIILTFALLIVTWSTVFSQIIVDKGIYIANFSNVFREPRYISYYLYKGGGDCDRAKFRFKNDDSRLQCATDEDYKGSSYDKGHLANAEDFAFDCAKDELTFRYYNCLPQTANLNRGVWKTNETLVRKWSQTNKLYIICGGFFGNKKIGNIAVPSYCWKVVQSVSSKKVLFCGWFSNTTKATVEEISVPELEKRLASKIILLE